MVLFISYEVISSKGFYSNKTKFQYRSVKPIHKGFETLGICSCIKCTQSEGKVCPDDSYFPKSKCVEGFV